MAGIVRVNTRISSDINNWLDNRSKQTGITKSTLIHLALDQYVQQQNATYTNQDLEEIKKEIRVLSAKVNQMA